MDDADADADADAEARLARKLAFVLEVDKLKTVLRQTLITGASRRENSAEHSWHLALMAVLLAEHADGPVDVLKVVKMLLVHDVVEVDAGDTYCYDAAAGVGKAERERAAAERIFAILPADAGGELRALWEEFEAGESPEARFANALDRLQPVMLNYATDGVAWASHGVTVGQVMERNRVIERGSRALWGHARGLIEEAKGRGWIR